MTVSNARAFGLASGLEHKFFTVVRWFVLILATISIVVTIVFAILGVQDATMSANTKVAPKDPQYSAFKNELSARQSTPRATGQTTSDPVRQKEIEAANAQADLDFEKKLQPFMARIVTSLTSYSNTLGQPAPASDPLRIYVKGRMEVIRDRFDDEQNLDWKYVEGLAKASEELAADVVNLVKFPQGDIRRAEFSQFVEWYTKTFFDRLQAERARIASEERDALEGMATAMNKVLIAAVAFGIFVAFTMLLVLLRIERNTRIEEPAPLRVVSEGLL